MIAALGISMHTHTPHHTTRINATQLSACLLVLFVTIREDHRKISARATTNRRATAAAAAAAAAASIDKIAHNQCIYFTYKI
jgi:hypothetical protein